MQVCTVLNATHEPLDIVTLRKGLMHILKGKAVMLEEAPGRFFRSGNEEHPVPLVVILKEYRKPGKKYYSHAKFNQQNLFIRDEYRCQYCGRHNVELKRGEFLTRDHVMPQSRGGKDDWMNCVTACSTCNHKKDNKTPAEAEMVLLKQPKIPTVVEIKKKRAERRKAA